MVQERRRQRERATDATVTFREVTRGLSDGRRANLQSAFDRVLFEDSSVAGMSDFLNHMRALHPGLEGLDLLEAITEQEIKDYIRTLREGGRGTNVMAIENVRAALNKWRNRPQ
jgi:hypothetical protein